MSKDLIKRHSEGVTHNTIGSVISTYLIQAVPAMTGLITALLAYFRNGIPLYLVILIGAFVFFLLAFAWYYIGARRRVLSEESPAGLQSTKLPTAEIEEHKRAFDNLKRKHDVLKDQLNGWERYAWLVSIAEAHADNIDQYVRLDRIERGDIQLNEGVPYVKFGIYITNNSVLEVSLELERGSYILFKEQKLISPIDVISDNFKNVKFQANGCLVIEQRLTREEAHYIASSEGRNDAWFYFDRLNITIKGRDRYPPQVKPKRLDMNKGVTLQNELITIRR